MNKAHPFEIAEMGTGPYTFVGMFSLPSPSLAESNPEAYNNALREMPKLSRGCGTCANCGMAIVNICIVRSSEGTLYGVGTDCVEKTGDASLGDKARVAVAKLRRDQARVKREARRAAGLAKWRLDNADKIAAEEASRANKEQADAARIAARTEAMKDLILALVGQRTDFHSSLAAQIPHGPLSERQAFFVAKAVLGRESKSNQEQFDQIICRCTTL